MNQYVNFRWRSLNKSVVILLLGFIISACAKAPEDEPAGEDFAAGLVIVNSLVTRSDWSSSRQRLTIRGIAQPGDTQVQLFDGIYQNALLGTAFVDSSLGWRFRKTIYDNTEVPCSVIARSNSAAQLVRVSNAPANCSEAYAGQISGDATNNPPDSVITSPAASRSIFIGDSIDFRGSATDPDGDASLRYLWNFAGASPNSSSLNPGAVQFNTAGIYTITFTATDSLGLADPTPAKVIITVNAVAANQAPNGAINSPGGNRIINLGDSLFFSGSGVDPDGSIASYLWSFSGSGVPTSSKQSPGSVQFNSVGTFTVLFTVTDNNGLADPSPASISVTVVDNNNTNASNNPPIGTISSPQANSSFAQGTVVDLSATATDPDGDTNLTFVWDFGGYAPRQTGKTASLLADKLGVISVKLLVRDSTRLWDPSPATTYFTVTESNNSNSTNKAPNTSITSPANNRTINVGDALNFSGEATDPDNDAMTYAWDFGASGVAASNSLSPGNKTFNQAGSYVVTFDATDSNGLSDPTPAKVTVVVNANRPPESTITGPANDRVITAGDQVNFTGTGSDPDGDTALTYLWNFNGGAVNSAAQNPGNVLFSTAGVYRVSFTVTDSSGLADPTPAEVLITVQSITANNQSPESTITAPAGNVTIQRGQSVTFNGTASDADNNTPMSYQWDFGGGAANSTQQNPGSIAFNQAGFFTVTLTATDSLGSSDPTPAIRYVRVLDNTANQAPISSISSPATDVTIGVGESVLFTGTATDPEKNTPLSYFWNFDGATLNSPAQNPGLVRFDNAGVFLVKLAATDNLGARDATPDVRVITVTNANSLTPPDSEITGPAGSMIISVGDSVNFQGRATGSNNNGPFSYAWNFVGAAPNSTLASPGVITFDNAGIYDISFRVTDSSGLSDPTPATVQIVVRNTLSVNEPPNGFILSPSSKTTIYAGDSLSFSAVGYDPDGDALNYLWSFDGGAPDQHVQNPGIIQFTTPGVYNVLMAVSDSTGLTDPTPATISLVVKSIASNENPPNALIANPRTDLTISEGDSVTFNGVVLDDNVVSYFWNFDGAAPNSNLDNPGSVTFTQAGTYRVRFNATDATGLSDPSPGEVVITVEQLNRPTGNLAPNGIINSPQNDAVITVGESINFTSTVVDPDNNTPFSYRWNFDGAVPNTTAQNPGWVTFNHVGTYRVVLTVTDSGGTSDATPAERIITVQGVESTNTPPNGTIVSPDTGRVINVGDTLRFAGGGTDPEFNFPMVYYWNFDGAVPNYIGATPGNITFVQEGVYDIQLKVVDSLGSIDPTPASVKVTVTNTTTSNQPPQSIIDSPTGNLSIFVNDSVSFSGSGIDPEGGVVTYHWRFGSSGIADEFVASPTVTFSNAGTYTVSLATTDANGLADPTPATVTITVQDNVALSNEPNGTIVSPAVGPVYINAGDSLTLESQIVDPNGDTNFFVVWNFGTYPVQNQLGETVRVTFTEPGLATVTLRVRDSTNLWDPTPASLEIYVQ